MKCLETRKRNGMRWRRYLTEDGRTLTTYELPTSVLAGITTDARLQARLSSWLKAEETRTKRQLVHKRLAEGVKPEAIAHEVGFSTSYIQRLRKRARNTERPS